MIKYLKKHYHFIIVVVLFLMMGIRGGISNNMSNLHLIPVTEALGITRGEFSVAGSASFLVATFATMFAGVLTAHFGYRFLLTALLLFGAGSMMLMGVAGSYSLFFLGYVLFGITNGVCGDVITTRLVSNWFYKRRGLFLGAVASATGISGSVICLFQAGLIQKFSYHASFYLAAALLAFVAILVMLFVRKHPSEIGLLPYGDGEKVDYKKREHEDHWQGYSMKQLLRMPIFYTMVAVTLITCILAYLVFDVVVPHLQDQGLTVTQAGSVQSVMLLSLTAAKILAGYLCDAIGARKVALLCLGLLTAGLLLLAMATGFAAALIAVVIYAASLPILTVIIPLLTASLFGYRAQTQYIGVFLAMSGAAGIVGSPVSNMVYDKAGSYSPVFLTAAALAAGMIFVYLFMYRRADKLREKAE